VCHSEIGAMCIELRSSLGDETKSGERLRSSQSEGAVDDEVDNIWANLWANFMRKDQTLMLEQHQEYARSCGRQPGQDHP
jgi:hypothetical protein